MDVAANTAYTAAWLSALTRARQPEPLLPAPSSGTEPTLEDHLERALRNAGAEEVPGPVTDAGRNDEPGALVDRTA